MVLSPIVLNYVSNFIKIYVVGNITSNKAKKELKWSLTSNN